MATVLKRQCPRTPFAAANDEANGFSRLVDSGKTFANILIRVSEIDSKEERK